MMNLLVETCAHKLQERPRLAEIEIECETGSLSGKEGGGREGRTIGQRSWMQVKSSAGNQIRLSR